MDARLLYGVTTDRSTTQRRTLILRIKISLMCGQRASSLFPFTSTALSHYSGATRSREPISCDPLHQGEQSPQEKQLWLRRKLPKKLARRRNPSAPRQRKALPKRRLKRSSPTFASLTRPKVTKRPKAEEDNPARRFGERLNRAFGSDFTDNLADLRVNALAATSELSPLNESSLTPVTPGGSNWTELGPRLFPTARPTGARASSSQAD